jgi:folate-binding protein YgfZ
MPDAFWCRVPRDVVSIDGPDALSYLHSQTSQDLLPLAIGASTWTFLLEPTGKIAVLARVLRRGEDSFLLDVDAGFGEALSARLARFKIRVKAEITPLDWTCVAVRGIAAPTPAAAAPVGDTAPASSGGETGAADGGAFVVVAGGAGPHDGYDLLGPAPQPPPALPEGSADDLERWRVEAAWPAMGGEIGAETIPGETGILDRAVSFTKGCYPGQELVERMDSRGAGAPRRLVPVSVPAGAAAGDPVVVDGADVGVLTSVSGDVAIASVKRSVPDERVPGLRRARGSEYRRGADDPV